MNILELKNISKSFGTFKANDDISFNVTKGEVHAILGENGAGKSTLMKVIYGEHSPDEGGVILLNNNQIKLKSPKHAIALGIGMVHQHFRQIATFSVLQNIILGYEPKNFFGFINYKKAQADVEKILNLYNFKLDLHSLVEETSIGTQQRIEIIKTLYRQSNVLIFDEPTAVLTPQEIEEFYKIVFNLKKEGKTILIITHKLHEIKTIADRCTIIRKGKYIETVNVSQTSEEDLAAKMVGRSVTLKVLKNEKESSNEQLLEIQNLTVLDNKNHKALDVFNLNLKKGFITGLAGIDGNGQSELVEALSGLRKITDGSIIKSQKNVTNLSAKLIYENKISTIPEDRQKVGLVLDFSIEDNLILHKLDDPSFSHNGLNDDTAITQNAKALIERFDIRPANPKASTRSLSGGNQQKIILAREIAHNPDVLVAFQPTRGLDVGAISFIHEELVKLRDSGKAVLLISYELDEILNLSDEIAVIYKGQNRLTIDYHEIKTNPDIKNKIGLYMSGGKL